MREVTDDRPPVLFNAIQVSFSGSSKGSERNSIGFTTLKMAVLPPTPIPMMMTAVAKKPRLWRTERST